MSTSAHLLKRHGAKRIYAYATHGLFTGDAIETLKQSVIQKIIVTNTCQLPKNVKEAFPDGRVTQVSAGLLISETIR